MNNSNNNNAVGSINALLETDEQENPPEENINQASAPEPAAQKKKKETYKEAEMPKQTAAKKPVAAKAPMHTSSVNSSLGTQYKKKGKGGFHFGGISELKLAFAFRQLGIMLKSGLALEGAITILAQQIDEERLRDIFAEMLIDIGNGVSVADSMRKHKNVFSNLVISLISSGEQGGTLVENLFILAEYLKKAHELRQKVKGALIYPLIVLGMTSFEMLGVVYFLLPKLDSMFSSFGNIPDFTKFVLDVAKFIRDNTTAIIIFLIVFIYLARYFFSKTKSGKRAKDYLGLNFPVFKNLNKNNILATFSQTFSLLLKNGIPINDALSIAAETNDNTIYIDALNKIQTRVMAGQSLSASMMDYQKLFPVTYIKMLEIGEETSSLADTLQYVHEFYAEEAVEVSNNLATLLEPILLIFIGVMIGGLAMIIIGPIYQLMGTINT